jgi:hypothetical protein
MRLVAPLRGQFAAHIDLHETTDTDETEFRPALAARDGKPFEPGSIPDGFYLVDDTENPQPAFQQAIIAAVEPSPTSPPPTRRASSSARPPWRAASSATRCALGLCASVTGARYTTTTEVYPDSPRATPEQCNAAQVAAVCAAIDFVLAHMADGNVCLAAQQVAELVGGHHLDHDARRLLTQPRHRAGQDVGRHRIAGRH